MYFTPGSSSSVWLLRTHLEGLRESRQYMDFEITPTRVDQKHSIKGTGVTRFWRKVSSNGWRIIHLRRGWNPNTEMKILGKEVTNDSSHHLVDPFLLVGFAISMILFLVSYPSLSSLSTVFSTCGHPSWLSLKKTFILKSVLPVKIF